MLRLNIEDDTIQLEDYPENQAQLVEFFFLYRQIIQEGKKRSRLLQFREKEALFAEGCAERGWGYLFGSPVTIWDKKTGEVLMKIILPEQTLEEFNLEIAQWKKS